MFPGRLCLVKENKRQKYGYIAGREGAERFQTIVPDNTESGTLNEEMFTWISIIHSYER